MATVLFDNTNTDGGLNSGSLSFSAPLITRVYLTFSTAEPALERPPHGTLPLLSSTSAPAHDSALFRS